ncbi:Type I restriction-modification system, methyltransferase subunit ['Chrysanthemum coronarium' phytoplasma]|uniref:Type I restriction-modification system, methyltransferase subunit n=2 Tax='Chrysanthemum coronarium' phytoplasma TaxID=1520703 RepID=A0ABQ0J3H3_9MOLU|nr:Type I restriction-modification system, methyltransferase subunit ['Chrysanthemum coronarium' phytoplasma]
MKFIILLKIGVVIITISKNDKIKENYNMKNDKNQNVQICKQKLWNLINNTLRNSVDTTIFKDYILPLLSFRYLSIKFEKNICKTTILGSLEKYKQAWDKWDSNEQSRFKNNIKGFCGFHI